MNNDELEENLLGEEQELEEEVEELDEVEGQKLPLTGTGISLQPMGDSVEKSLEHDHNAPGHHSHGGSKKEKGGHDHNAPGHSHVDGGNKKSGHDHNAPGHSHGDGGNKKEGHDHVHGKGHHSHKKHVDHDTLNNPQPKHQINVEETDPVKDKPLKKLVIVSMICLLFMAVEIVGGILANSLAILTDAAHLMSDIAGFMISIFAIWLGRKKATVEFSYGWHRAEIIGALISIVLIWGLTAWLVYEAVLRLMNPSEVDGLFMLGTAIFGLCCNIVMAKVLHGNGHSHGGHSHGGHGGGDEGHDEDGEDHQDHDDHEGHDHGDGGENQGKPKKKKAMTINERAAYIHILGDLIQSIGVVIAGVVIYIWPSAHLADPISTLVFACLVMATTWGVCKSCIKTMMEASPENMDVPALKQALRDLPGVHGIHCCHVWNISDGQPALTVHIESEECTGTLVAANNLCAKYGISHTTIQVENCCENSTLGELNCVQNVHQAIKQ